MTRNLRRSSPAQYAVALMRMLGYSLASFIIYRGMS